MENYCRTKMCLSNSHSWTIVFYLKLKLSSLHFALTLQQFEIITHDLHTSLLIVDIHQVSQEVMGGVGVLQAPLILVLALLHLHTIK